MVGVRIFYFFEKFLVEAVEFYNGVHLFKIEAAEEILSRRSETPS